MAMILAMVFGPFIGLNLGNINEYNFAFVLCMVISAVNIVFALLMKEPQHTLVNKAHFKNQSLSFNDIIDKKAAPFALATFLLAFAYSGVSAFLSLYAKKLGLIGDASYFFIAYAVFILIFRPFAGRWSDIYGPKIIVYPSIVLFAMGLIMLQQTHTGGTLVLAGAIIGIGYGSVTPIFQTQTISSVESPRVGIANAMFFSSMDAGMAVGAYVLGTVASIAGYRSVYLVGTILIVVAGIYYFVTTMKRAVRLQTLTDRENQA